MRIQDYTTFFFSTFFFLHFNETVRLSESDPEHLGSDIFKAVLVGVVGSLEKYASKHGA